MTRLVLAEEYLLACTARKAYDDPKTADGARMLVETTSKELHRKLTLEEIEKSIWSSEHEGGCSTLRLPGNILLLV